MKQITLQPYSHGHYKATTIHRGKTYSAIITDMTLVDKYNQLRTDRARGYKSVCKLIHERVMQLQ